MGKIYAPGIVSVEVLNVIKAIASSLSTVIKKNHSIYELQEVLIVHVLQNSTQTNTLLQHLIFFSLQTSKEFRVCARLSTLSTKM